MAGEGEILRQARENKGWSLQQAEKITKIRVRYLKAMEEEDYAVLPGTTYAKGFLRTYAKHLELNQNEIVGLASSAFSEKTQSLSASTVPVKNKPVWLRPVVSLSMACLAIFIVVIIAHFSKTQGNVGEDYSPPLMPSAPSINDMHSQNNLPSSNDTNPPSAIAATNNNLTAKFVFTEPCWLLVEADGKQVFQGTFATGTRKEVNATSSIKLVTVGNAGGVTISLNDITLPSLGKSGEVVNNIILTKDTLNQF